MALEVREEVEHRPTTLEQEVLRRGTDDLRRWLLDLEGWVEVQVAATRALVALLSEDGESAAGARPTNGRVRLGR